MHALGFYTSRHSHWSESFLITFIDAFQSVQEGGDVHIYGPREGVAMVLHILAYMHEGFILLCVHLSGRWGF